MFEEMISWGELITLVLFVLGSALLFYLILAVSNLLRVIKNVNNIIESNKDKIQKTIDRLPEITDNAAKITGTVKENLDDIQHVFKDVGKISDTVKRSVDTIQNDIILKAKSILDIIDAIKRMIEKRREKNKKKKGTVYKYKYKPGQDKPEEVEVVRQEEETDEPYRDYVKVGDDGASDSSDRPDGSGNGRGGLKDDTSEDIDDYKTTEE